MHVASFICQNPPRFCPSCGAKTLGLLHHHAFQCTTCNFLYFHNVAATAVVIISVGEEILLTIRARDPHKGKLDLPGGFVDHGESSEEAAVRELKEELDLTIDKSRLTYLCSCANLYPYSGISYHTTDAIFTLSLNQKPTMTPADDVANVLWMKPSDIPANEICFPAMAKAISTFLQQNNV